MRKYTRAKSYTGRRRLQDRCAEGARREPKMPHEPVLGKAALVRRTEDGPDRRARRQGPASSTSRGRIKKAKASPRLHRFPAGDSGRRMRFAAWWTRCGARASAKRAILWGMGGHVVKCGLARCSARPDAARLGDRLRDERRGIDSRFRDRHCRPNQRGRGGGAAGRAFWRGRRDRSRDERGHRRRQSRRAGHGRSARASAWRRWPSRSSLRTALWRAPTRRTFR